LEYKIFLSLSLCFVPCLCFCSLFFELVFALPRHLFNNFLHYKTISQHTMPPAHDSKVWIKTSVLYIQTLVCLVFSGTMWWLWCERQNQSKGKDTTKFGGQCHHNPFLKSIKSNECMYEKVDCIALQTCLSAWVRAIKSCKNHQTCWSAQFYFEVYTIRQRKNSTPCTTVIGIMCVFQLSLVHFDRNNFINSKYIS
jgi:hypothetical protein